MIKNNDPLFIRIVELLKNQGKTQKELTDHLGITSNAFTDWKSGRLKSYQKYLYEIASFLGVSVAYLKGESDEPKRRPTIMDIAQQGHGTTLSEQDAAEISKKYANGVVISQEDIYMIPVFESVSAGFGAYADENVTEYTPICFSNALEANNTICVKVLGDSMYPKIENGDVIQVYKTDSVDSGTLAVVMLDGDEALVKKLNYGNGWIELVSINPMYPPIRLEREDTERIKVVGQVTRIIKEV